MGTLLLALGTGAVGATGVLFASCLRLRFPIGFLLAAYLFASSEVVAGSLLLSTERWLTRDALLGVIGVGFGVAVVVWATLGRPHPPLTVASIRSLRFTLRDPILALLAGLTVVSQLYLLAVSLTVPQSVTDTMLYHLPRSALWKQQHAVSYVANMPEVAVNVFPPNAEIETAATMILSGGDRFVGLVQLVAVAFACIAIVGVARRLGFDRRAAVFAALAFSTFTVVMLQTPTALNDLVVASFLIACAYFALGAARIDLVLGALALALALGTKLTTVFALPALALVVFGSQPRRRWLAVALYGAAGIAVGSIWLLVNVVETGRLDGGVPIAPENQELVDRILRSLADLLEMSDAEGKGLLVSPLWGVPALLLALVGAAALCSRKRWRAAALVGLAGVFAFVSLPLLVTWTQVAAHVVRHARVAIGLGGAVSGPRLPEGFYESPMHSSYGLAFVLLFLASGSIVAADVARRRSSFAVLAALIGVPLTLLIAAIAIGFDPQHSRYLAFPVALAASVFGIVLRVRALAWTAGALAAVTVVVTLGYFVPRPGGLTLLAANRGVDRARLAGSPRGEKVAAIRRPSDSSKSPSLLGPRSRWRSSPTRTSTRPGTKGFDAECCSRRPRVASLRAQVGWWRVRASISTRPARPGRECSRAPQAGASIGARGDPARCGASRLVPMCRNIRTLHNFEPPATEDEVHAAALQYVRKVSGSQKPSKANEAAFARAVDEVAHITGHLLAKLVTTAPARDRELEAARARERAAKRFGRAA